MADLGVLVYDLLRLKLVKAAGAMGDKDYVQRKISAVEEDIALLKENYPTAVTSVQKIYGLELDIFSPVLKKLKDGYAGEALKELYEIEKKIDRVPSKRVRDVTIFLRTLGETKDF
jgi:lipopolysaccharide biosynthesis regulator YciM